MSSASFVIFGKALRRAINQSVVAFGHPSRALLPAAKTLTIASTSKTLPPQVPPLTSCRAAQSRVSSGSAGSGARSGLAARPSSTRGSRVRADEHAALADEIDRALELHAIDDDLDQIAIAELADRAAGQRFGRDVSDARARRHAAEPRVGEDGDVLAERQISKRRGELIRLFHPRAHRSAADQHQDVTRLDPAFLDRRHRRWLGGEDLRRAGESVHAIGRRAPTDRSPCS